MICEFEIKSVTSKRLTKNRVVNKLLLSDLSLKDDVEGCLQVIDVLRHEYIHRRLSKQDLDERRDFR